MKEKRKFSPKIPLSPMVLRADSRIRRARKLAEASLPLVADLYVAHIQACAEDWDGKRKRRRKTAVRGL